MVRGGLFIIVITRGNGLDKFKSWTRLFPFLFILKTLRKGMNLSLLPAAVGKYHLRLSSAALVRQLAEEKENV